MSEDANWAISDLTIGDDRWKHFASQQTLSLFQSPDWASVIEKTYNFPARAMVLLQDGIVVGGIPYAEIEDFRGARKVTYAFADVCEPIGICPIPLIQKYCADDRIQWRIRSRNNLGGLAKQHPAGFHHTLRLPTEVGEALEACHPKQRANVKQAEKAGVTFRKSTESEGLETFFALHSELRKTKHRLLPQPRSFFE